MDKIFADFSELLSTRLGADTKTTEDSVRYTFFASLLKNCIEPHNVILESPHPSIARAMVDTWIHRGNERDVAIEFKYDRDPPGGKNQPKTQKAGKAFHDLARLSKIAEDNRAECYFVYLTTEQMATYFRNSSNGHDRWFELTTGESMRIDSQYFGGKPATFLSALGSMFSADVICRYTVKVGADHHLRIFEVQKI